MATKKVELKTPVVTPEKPVGDEAKRLQTFLDKEKITIHADALSNLERIVDAGGKLTGYIIREPQIKASAK